MAAQKLIESQISQLMAIYALVSVLAHELMGLVFGARADLAATIVCSFVFFY